jgi:hypothetical protein
MRANWDYGSNGIYFITICTQNREHFFGNIIHGKMQLNKIGALADKYWHEIPQHFLFIKLGEFVVMPKKIFNEFLIFTKNFFLRRTAFLFRHLGFFQGSALLLVMCFLNVGIFFINKTKHQVMC